MVPFYDTPFENTHIFAQIFSSETKIVIFACKLCLQTANREYKNQRTVYEYVNFLFNQLYVSVIFLKSKYIIGLGFKKLAHTPVPKSPPPRGCGQFSENPHNTYKLNLMGYLYIVQPLVRGSVKNN